MPVNDNLTYSRPKTAAGNSAERALITPDRSQKLDLLIHLLANLQQTVVVCGPKGIGKTTLLQTLEANRKDQWWICLQQGSSSLSFETIIINLSRFLNLDDSNFGFDLSSLRRFCEKQKVVLIIDEAGDLVPGLIGELVDFSESLPGLRLVFSMTYDEFHIKSASDKTLDDCHFIEIPPLNLKQCSEYLQNLSAQPGAVISFNAVTEHLVENLYRETHGIPGRILAELPKFNQYRSHKIGRWGLWLGVLLVCLAAAWSMKILLPKTSLFEAKINKQPETIETITTPLPIPRNSSHGEPTLPTVEIPELTTKEQDTVLPQKPEEQKTEIIVGWMAKTNPALNKAPEHNETPVPNTAESNANNHTETIVGWLAKTNPAQDKALEHIETPALNSAESNPNHADQIQPAPKPSVETAKIEAPATDKRAQGIEAPKLPIEINKKTPETKPEKPGKDIDSLDWIKAQPSGNYTLQVMVLSNKLSVQRFLKKHAELADSLKYYSIGKNDLEKFVVIYGSFPSIADAKNHKAILPNEFKNSLEKRFRFIQNESKR